MIAQTAENLRQSCLVALGDRLRTLDKPSDIAGAAAEILGRALGCSRAGYVSVKDGFTMVENDWSNGSVGRLSGRHLFAALGETFTGPLRRGETVAVADVRGHAATSDNEPAWAALQTRAVLNVPLLESGGIAALFYAHDLAPRHWSAEDIALVKDTADRTWEAMGRARAVAALRALNESLEREVRERTAQRDRMWNLSNDIMMATGLDKRIQSVNPAWTTLLGWSEAETLGRPFTDFVHAEDDSKTAQVSHTLREGKTTRHLENRYRTKQGGYCWLSWQAAPDGDVIHSAGRDITAEIEQAAALAAAEEALRHAQKMEAVGQLTGGLAHDFNNILQGIAGSLELVQKRIEQGRFTEVAGHAANAMASAQRAGALTHRLLAFSRRQPLDPKPLAANPLIREMAPLLRRTLGEQITLDLALAEDLWTILCDPNQLDSAILNLTINARDAMPDGGGLTIRTENTVLGPAYAATAGVPPGDYVALAVSDTGIGMPPDVIERAFDPFYTTKPIGQGTGLGLSMVYGFMRQSEGHANISSAVGQGTAVVLYLPRCRDQPAAAADEDAAAPAHQAAQGATVLVMEDEALVRDIVVEVLEELGYAALEANDGPSGLEILRGNRRIDLLVTDVGLPGLNGRQVAEAGRLLRPGLKVLFMTGYAESAATSGGFLEPGMEMITKPFAIDSLAARIKTIIEST